MAAPRSSVSTSWLAVAAIALLAGCTAGPKTEDAGRPRPIITTIIGKNGTAGYVDGDPTTARMFWPEGLALDSARQQLYIADTANQAIRRFDLTTQQLDTVAGVGNVLGFTDSRQPDGGLIKALMNTPRELALDPTGDALWFTDTGNDVIRRLDLTTLEVTTHFGSPGQSGAADGVGAQARFGNPPPFLLWPGAILFDDAGTMFVSDGANNTIRTITMATGEVRTIAGVALDAGWRDGAGNQALFNKPMGLAFDLSGGLIVAEANNIVLRRVDLTTHEVTTVAGKAPPAANLFCEVASPSQPRECGWVDAPKGVDARFRFPFGMVPDGQGGLFVIDSHNDLIRLYDMRTTAVSTVAGEQHTILVDETNHPSTDTSDTDPGTFWHPTHAVFQPPDTLYVSDRSANCIRKVVFPR